MVEHAPQDPTFAEGIENFDDYTEEEWKAIYGDAVPFPAPLDVK
jgi:hypothetical protein